MWYCCLAVISLCKRCGLLYKWGFSHHLYQVNVGERIHPCRLIRCNGGFLARGLSQQAVQCCAAVWAQPAQTQLWSRGVLGRWRALCSVPFLGVRGVCWLHWGCCLCNLLVVEVLSARHRHQTAEASDSQRSSGISPPLQDRIILFRVATVQWLPEATHGYKCVASVSWYLFYGFFSPFHQMTKLQWCYGLAWIYESHSTWHILKQRV